MFPKECNEIIIYQAVDLCCVRIILNKYCSQRTTQSRRAAFGYAARSRVSECSTFEMS